MSLRSVERKLVIVRTAWNAVLQPAVPPMPCVTSRRNETLLPDDTVSPTSGVVPNRSCMLCVGSVGSAWPLEPRNRMPG